MAGKIDGAVNKLIFMGEKAADPQRKQVIEVVGAAALKDVLLEPTPGVQKSNLDQMIGQAGALYGGNFHSVAEVENTIVVSGGKDVAALETRNLMCDVLLFAMRDGGDANLAAVINAPNSPSLASSMHPDLNPWAREIRNKVITNNNIAAILDQATANIDEVSEPAYKISELQIAYRALKAVTGAPPHEVELAKNAIKALFDEEVHPRPEISAQQRSPDLRPVTNAEGVVEYEQMTYDMKYSRLVELESQIRGVHWYAERPPAWFEGLTKVQQSMIENRIDLLNACYSKKMIRNADLEKVRLNVPETKTADVKELWDNMPGFSKAVRYMVNDLCEMYPNADGRMLLRLKLEKGPDGKVISKKIDKETKQKVEYLSGYKKEVVAEMMKANPGMSNTQATEAVSVAWNFLYIGDLIESADLYRELTPSTCVGDQVRTADHPGIKAKIKWGIERQYFDSDKQVTAPGMQEPFVSLKFYYWIKNNIRHDPKFKDRLISGDLKDILPETMCVSMIEATKLVNPNGQEVSFAMALMDREHYRGQDRYKYDDEWISKTFNVNDKNIMQPFNDMREGAFWLAMAFKGKVKYDAKNEDALLTEIAKSTSLVRQEPHILLADPKEKGPDGKLITMAGLTSVDTPAFYAFLLAVMVGFDPRLPNIILDSGTLGIGPFDAKKYCNKVQLMVEMMTVDSPVDVGKVLDLLSARNESQANLSAAANIAGYAGNKIKDKIGKR